MRKLFSLFAVMLLAITVNATKTTITPTSWEGGTVADRSLFRAITQSSVDTIILDGGTYTESQSITVAANRNVVMIAAEGKSPVVQCSGYFDVYASVVAIGIKFQFVGEAANGYGFYVHNNANKYIKLEGCTFIDYTNPCVEEASSSYHLDSLLVNNCKFYNISNSCIHLKETTDSRVVITYSTFANIDASAVDAAVVEIRTTAGIVKVDNCTFYDCVVKNFDYGAIKCTSSSPTNILISNCIVALSATDTRENKIRAIHTQGSKVIKNCLTFNYVQNSNSGMRDGTYENCLINQDPLFKKPADLNFTLDEENSPAHEAGIGGTHLGDSCWWPKSWAPIEIIPVSAITLDKDELALEVDESGALVATVSPDDATDPTVIWTSSNNAIAKVSGGVVEGVAAGEAVITATAGDKSASCTVTVSAATIPSTDFASPLVLAGKKAHIEGNIWKNASDNLYYNNKSTQGVASWKVTVTKPCVVTGIVNGIVKTGQNFELDLYDEGDNRIDSIANPKAREWGNGGNPNVALDSTNHSTLTFPAAGTYTLKLRNEMKWSSCEFASLTLTLVDYFRTLYLEPNADWKTDGARFAIYTKDDEKWYDMTAVAGADGFFEVTIGASINEVIFCRMNGAETANNWGNKWNQTSDLTIDAPNDLCVITGWNNSSYWARFANIADGYYIIGLNTWDPMALTAADKLVKNELETTIDEWMLENVTLTEGQAFKAIKVAGKILTNWYGSKDGNNYDVTKDVAGVKTIYFSPDYQYSWAGHLYVQLNGGTSIDNTDATEKAVKFIENGQLFIIKNGVKYNVLGAVIR